MAIISARYQSSNVSSETVVRREIKPELQRSKGETYAMIKALNKLTELGMPETQYVV